MKKVLLLTAILLAGCSSALPSPTQPPTPLIWQVQASPALGWYAAVLNQCAQEQAGAHITFNRVPTARLDATAADITLRWGAAPDLSLPAVVLGEDELIFIVHPSNPVTALASADLKQLLGGKVLTWEKVSASAFKEPVVVYVYETREDIQQLLNTALPGISLNRETAWLAPDPAAVLEAVAASPGAVGYLPARWFHSSVKKLNISDLPQSALRQPVLAVTRQQPQGLLELYLRCLSDRTR